MRPMLSQHRSEMRDNALSTQIDCLPPLSYSLKRLLEIVQDENASAGDLENLIRHDEALCAKILRIANSAFYGLRGRVRTLSRAIMTIGFHEVKSICLFSMLVETFPVRGRVGRFYRERLWKHALMSAKHAFEIARVRPWVPNDEAYVLGLLHDLGWLVMLVCFSEDYLVINQMAGDEEIPLWEAESQHNLKHTQIGNWVAIKWGLPEGYQRAMVYHHFPERSPTFQPVVRIVSLANVLAHLREYPELASSESVISSCRELRISDSDWQEHMDRVEEIEKEVDQLWHLLK